MSEAGRHVELAIVGRAQLERLVLHEARRIGAQVDDDVHDGALHATHELGFDGVAMLEMHAANGALLRGDRSVLLHEG